MSRADRKTVPALIPTDDEISQEIALRQADPSLNEKHVEVTAYSWSGVALSHRRTAPLPPNWVAPKLP